jgi:TolB-like protein
MRPEPPEERSPTAADRHARLSSWKEIAAYLGKDVRTAMRWERSRGLPVHRLSASSRAPVFALRTEIDDWRARHSPGPVARAKIDWYDARLPSLAVLPFDNRSADPDDEPLAAGLAAQIIASLARMPEVRVIGAASTFAASRADSDVQDAASRLGAGAVLHGSVEHEGHRLRISAQLTDVPTGASRWCLRYDHRLADIFAVQADITHHAARYLAAPFAPPELPHHAPRNPHAYLLALKGLALLHRPGGGTDEIEAARSAFTEAIGLDPSLARAHLGVAESLFRQAAAGFAGAADALAACGRAAQRALELDESLGEAHALLAASIASLDLDWGRTERHFRDALDLCPGSGLVRSRHALTLLAPTRRLDRALAELEAAAGIDPLTAVCHFQLAHLLLSLGRTADAERRADTAIALDPRHPDAGWIRGAILSADGRTHAARAALGRGNPSPGASPRAAAGRGAVLAALGRAADARGVLDDLSARSDRVSPALPAWIHAFLGETEQAFACLDRAADERDPEVLDLAWKWTYGPLRSHPRFDLMLSRLHLAAGPVRLKPDATQ